MVFLVLFYLLFLFPLSVWDTLSGGVFWERLRVERNNRRAVLQYQNKDTYSTFPVSRF
jgi:hypothetical protein